MEFDGDNGGKKVISVKGVAAAIPACQWALGGEALSLSLLKAPPAPDSASGRCGNCLRQGLLPQGDGLEQWETAERKEAAWLPA